MFRQCIHKYYRCICKKYMKFCLKLYIGSEIKCGTHAGHVLFEACIGENESNGNSHPKIKLVFQSHSVVLFFLSR
jgi:hypothetical protein